MAVGVVGALIGGLIGEVALGHKVHASWSLGPFLLAVAGAVVLLLALEAIAGSAASGAGETLRRSAGFFDRTPELPSPIRPTRTSTDDESDEPPSFPALVDLRP